MHSYNPNWKQPGDFLYLPPAGLFSRPPIFRMKDIDDIGAAARWPTPFPEEEIDIAISAPPTGLGLTA